MAPFYKIFAASGAIWLLSVAASLLAFYWGSVRSPRRIRAALVLSLAVLAIGWLGMTRFRVTFRKTVDGHSWGVDSKWFFLAILILGFISLAVTIWNFRRPNRAADPAV